jgi:hypothetical protein
MSKLNLILKKDVKGISKLKPSSLMKRMKYIQASTIPIVESQGWRDWCGGEELLDRQLATTKVKE